MNKKEFIEEIKNKKYEKCDGMCSAIIRGRMFKEMIESLKKDYDVSEDELREIEEY
jgi:aromatic ring hydroxylase